jgi:hypothetical protein
MTKPITHGSPKSFKDKKNTQNNNLHSSSRGINFLAKRKHTKDKTIIISKFLKNQKGAKKIYLPHKPF